MIDSMLYVTQIISGLVVMRKFYDGQRLWPLLVAASTIIPFPTVVGMLA
jgi:hypothetical protein